MENMKQKLHRKKFIHGMQLHAGMGLFMCDGTKVTHMLKM